ncbi:MAG TPA: VCBS repeat-containing protein, partial [Polyangiaceae bacterium]
MGWTFRRGLVVVLVSHALVACGARTGLVFDDERSEERNGTGKGGRGGSGSGGRAAGASGRGGAAGNAASGGSGALAGAASGGGGATGGSGGRAGASGHAGSAGTEPVPPCESVLVLGTLPAIVVPFAERVVAGDMNRDGSPDIVAAGHDGRTGTGRVQVLLGRGDGTFASEGSHEVGDEPHSLAIGDLDGDGWLDVVVADLEDDWIGVLA